MIAEGLFRLSVSHYVIYELLYYFTSWAYKKIECAWTTI